MNPIVVQTDIYQFKIVHCLK